MAFEDRCSPNEANSPGPVSGRVPALHQENLNGYSSPSQYTCTTIQYERQVKQSAQSPQNYYERPETPDLKPIVQERPQQAAGVNFSISNILRPEFGLSAIRKTSKIEGPKSVGPNHSILYKPYDLSKRSLADGCPEYERAKEDDRLLPLGGLRQAVSQIGHQEARTRPKRPDSASSMVSSTSSGAQSICSGQESAGSNGKMWPAWVFCTRYSDRPSSGPRSKRAKKEKSQDEKRPRTAFSGSQLARLKHEFAENRYLTERRRQALASELGLAEAQIKIWFQNKRAKIKKASGQRNPLALQLMAQGLYNHTTATDSDEEEIHVT